MEIQEMISPGHSIIEVRTGCNGRDKESGMKYIVSLLPFFLSSALAAADSILVDPMGGGRFTAIQPAIDEARDGDTVLVMDGVYRGPGNRDIDFHGKAIILRSLNGPDNCIMDCEGSEADPHRGFYFHSGEGEDSVLEGFTITNGFIAGSDWPTSAGGGILCLEPHSSPTIRNNKIVGNEAYHGGGICCFGSPTITNNLIKGNRASEGGGINCYEWGTISNNIIQENEAERGGGILVWEDYAPVIINNRISGNLAEECGGGIAVFNTSPSIVGNLIANNTSGDGGGLFLPGKSTINAFNTITGNRASQNGAISGASNFTNCIVWGNSSPGSTSEATYSCIEGWAGNESNINLDPLFVDPAGGNYRLMPASPCINSGDSTDYSIHQIDLDGNQRPCWEGVDMGAYEYCGDEPPSNLPRFRRGDLNADGNTDIADAVNILAVLFTGSTIHCRDAADVNDDSKNDISDVISLLGYLFLENPAPKDPFPHCGIDATLDALTCDSYPCP